MGLSMTPWRLPDPTRWQLSTCRVGSNIVDAQLNPPDSVFTVIMNSAEDAGGTAGDHSVGSQVPVRRAPSGTAYVEIRNVGPSEALVLVNRP